MLLGCPLLTFAQKTGIEGKLYSLPTASNLSQPNQAVAYSGIPLELFIHAPTTLAEVDGDEDGISKIYTPLIKRSFSKWDGSFKIKLPPGAYSVFVLYKNRYYGNLQDKNGNLSPAYVVNKKRAWVTVTLTYTPYH